MMKRLTTLLLLGLLAWWASSAAFAVDETEFAVVTQFGRPIRHVMNAGLQFKWPAPIQSVLRFDRRLQVFETPLAPLTPSALAAPGGTDGASGSTPADPAAPAASANQTPGRSSDEFLTRDKKNVVVETYTAWRIAADPAALSRFLQTVRDVQRAQVQLRDLVISELGATLGEQPFSALITTNAADWKWPELVASIGERCKARALADFGIQIVDFQIQRLSFPDQNRRSVFDRMRTERERIATQYRSEGDAEARKIRAEADLKAAEIRSAADEEYLRVVGSADAEATRIYGEAYGRDPDYYEFERSLDTLALAMGDNATAVFSAANRFLAPLIQYATTQPARPTTTPAPVAHHHAPASRPADAEGAAHDDSMSSR